MYCTVGWGGGGGRKQGGPGGVSSPQQLLGCFLMLAPMHTIRDKKGGKIGGKGEAIWEYKIGQYFSMFTKGKETALFGSSPTCRWLSGDEKGKKAARVGLVPP